MDNKLEAIVKDQQLDKNDVQKMAEAFGAPFEEAGVVLAEYKNIKVTDVSQTEDMQKAREMRLTLKKARTTVENNRKELKADIVKQGRAIDTIARYVKEEIEPAEQYLELQEKFVELKKAKEAEELKAKRTSDLMLYTDDISVYNLDVMTAEQFTSLLETLKDQYQAKVEADKKAEADMLAGIKAENERVAEQAKENERLKKEAEARESEHRAEREANAKKEAEAQAEAKKIQDAKDAELRAEREKREAIEAKQREEAEADRRAKDVELEAERTAMLAPDKQKLVAFAKGLEIVRIERLPAVKTNKAQELINYVDDELKRLSEYLIKAAKEL